jgi:hypothetical protein
MDPESSNAAARGAGGLKRRAISFYAMTIPRRIPREFLAELDETVLYILERCKIRNLR